MKILSDESRISRLSPNLWHGVVKISITLSGTLQDEQVGVLIIKLKDSSDLNISEIKRSQSGDDTKAGFPQLIHWCIAFTSAFPGTFFSLNLYYFTSHCVQ